MSHLPSDTQIDALAQRVRPGSTVLRAWRLEGGVSAQVTAIELALPDGGNERIVVRRHGEIDKGHNRDIARDEFRLLNLLHISGMEVPAPLHVDETGVLLGEPCLVIESVDGSTEIPPEAVPDAIGRMAVFLARLHALELDQQRLSFLSRLEDPVGSTLRHLPDTEATARIRDTLAAHGSPADANAPALLHGDYWPGNILWRDGKIAAVLDWEDAAIGDPVADLAGSRLELLWKFDPEVMERFTARYLSLSPIDLADLPLWELTSASGAVAHMSKWGLDAATEAEMREKAWWLMERARQQLETGAGRSG